MPDIVILVNLRGKSLRNNWKNDTDFASIYFLRTDMWWMAWMIRPPTLVTSLQLTSGMSMGLFLSFVSTSAKNKICRVCMPWFTSSLCILLHVVTSCMSRTLVPASLVCTGWLYIYIVRLLHVVTSCMSRMLVPASRCRCPWLLCCTSQHSPHPCLNSTPPLLIPLLHILPQICCAGAPLGQWITRI